MATEDGYVPKPAHATPAAAAKACNKWVDLALTKNKTVQFLIEHLESLGCTPPDRFIQCVDCPEPAAGSFGMVEENVLKNNTESAAAGKMNDPAAAIDACDNMGSQMKDLKDLLDRENGNTSSLSIKPEIHICQQYMRNKSMAHRTLVHELIHAIDFCRAKLDPLHNCVQLACTEIRAEHLSGECYFFQEFPRMFFEGNLYGHGKECVKRRAILSVRANPNCTARASDCVEAAMERCYKDVYPFERHPKQLF
jgi:Peptidase M76 family